MRPRPGRNSQISLEDHPLPCPWKLGARQHVARSGGAALGLAHREDEGRLLRGVDKIVAAHLLLVPRLHLQDLCDLRAGTGQVGLHVVIVEHRDDVPQGLQTVGIHPGHVLHGEHYGLGPRLEDALDAIHVPVPGQEVQLPEELVEEDAVAAHRRRETLPALAREQLGRDALLPAEVAAGRVLPAGRRAAELVELGGVRHVRVVRLRAGQLRLQLRLLGGLILRGVRVLPLLARQVHLVDLEGIDGDHLGRPVREPLVACRRD
mmetsp:Transcript_19377/g.50939  ORF Transcript_19377/g.50939 Transcript_19377/m.50939 type:complete len:263 (-) Transcript_19377:437-1225(-)